MTAKTEIREFPFESKAYSILPGVTQYHCEKHDLDLRCTYPIYTEVGTISDDVHINDIEVVENRFFNYRMVTPAGAKSVIPIL